MPQFELENETPCSVEPLFVTDESGTMLLVSVVKATYAIGKDGTLRLADKQHAVNVTGEHWGDAGHSSLKYESETSFFKSATDVVLIGRALSNDKRTTEMMAGIQLGKVRKLIRVVGNRTLTRRRGQTRVSAPQPIEEVPLIYERAFGGWDPTPGAQGGAVFEARNPVGKAFRMAQTGGDEVVPLPNLEDVDRPYREYGDVPTPAGVGFVSPHWQPRARFAGTYDEVWSRGRKPLLPLDFDRRFFNAASPGLICDGYLTGTEDCAVLNACSEPRVNFRLPASGPVSCEMQSRGNAPQLRDAPLDTVIVNMDERLVFMLWRAHFSIPGDPQDLVSLTVRQGEPR